MEKEVTFTIDRKNILNSNNLNGMNRFAIGKIVSSLKTIGYETGVEYHSEPNKTMVQQRKEIFDILENNKIIKSRITKRTKKNNPQLEKKELDTLVLDEYNAMNLEPEQKYDEIPVVPLFTLFQIEVTVKSPTRRRLDPVNLYPTVKPLIDGMTIAGFWEDDDWRHLHQISFKYGGISDIKNEFQIIMTITEIEPSATQQIIM